MLLIFKHGITMYSFLNEIVESQKIILCTKNFKPVHETLTFFIHRPLL